MNALPMPRRLLNALVPQPARTGHAVEPLLRLDSLPPLPPAQAPAPAPLGRRAIEQVLEEGSRRIYGAMQEAEVIETRPR
jgi:hypothetical protein